MQLIKVNLSKISKKEIGIISDFLRKGKVIIYPTDTIYGIGCLADNKKAIRRIFKIKQKDKNKPLLVLAGSLARAKKYCRIGKKQADYVKKIWPGPVSVILESRGVLPEALTGNKKGAGLGIRLPKNDFLIKILKSVKTPIVSTSANMSGGDPIYDPKYLDKCFKKEKPDLMVDGGVLKGKASKLVDLRDMDNIKILRK